MQDQSQPPESTSIPSFGFSQAPFREYTPAHNYRAILIPTDGLDFDLRSKLGDLMQWSDHQTEDSANLSFLLMQTFAQMGTCYDGSLAIFMDQLQGISHERGNVPGFPQTAGLELVPFGDRWGPYVQLFRHYALLFYHQVSRFHATLGDSDLVYQSYMPTAWCFIYVPRRFYGIDA